MVIGAKRATLIFRRVVRGRLVELNSTSMLLRSQQSKHHALMMQLGSEPGVQNGTLAEVKFDNMVKKLNTGLATNVVLTQGMIIQRN